MRTCTHPRLAVLAAALALAAPAARADAPDPSPAGQIVVTGTGTVSIPPTKGSFSITVETAASTAAAASEANARISKAVMDALATSALAAGDIKGADLEVSPRWDYEEERRPRRTAYEATNTIRIETGNLKGIGSVIDAALSAGATGVSDVTFESSEIESARTTALTKAVQAARAEAEIIARANGGSLGELVLMNTQSRATYGELNEVVVSANRVGSKAPVPTEILPSDVTVTRSIEGRWRFVAGATK